MPSHSMIISPGHGFLQGTVARRGQVPELKEPGGLWRQTINHVLVTAASFSAGWGGGEEAGTSERWPGKDDEPGAET